MFVPPPQFSVTYGLPLGLWPILILAIFASKIRNCVLILQRYNLFELSIQSRLYCAHGTKYIALFCFRYYASVHISGGLLPSVQRNGILISILVFLIPHYMKLLLHALTQIHLSYLRIFVFSIFPLFPLIYRQCLYVQYFAPTVRVRDGKMTIFFGPARPVIQFLISGPFGPVWARFGAPPKAVKFNVLN